MEHRVVNHLLILSGTSPLSVSNLVLSKVMRHDNDSVMTMNVFVNDQLVAFFLVKCLENENDNECSCDLTERQILTNYSAEHESEY